MHRVDIPLYSCVISKAASTNTQERVQKWEEMKEMKDTGGVSVNELQQNWFSQIFCVALEATAEVQVVISLIQATQDDSFFVI